MTKAPSPSTRHVYRQKSPLVMGALFGVCAAVLLVSTLMAWSTSSSAPFLSWLLLASAVSWAALVRPSVVLDQQGVHLRNIVRDVYVPWPLVTGVEARWNVQVLIEGRHYTAWAISSRAERPRLRPSPALAGPGSLPGSKVTAQLVGAAIEQTKANFEVSVATGAVQPAAEARVRVSWAVPSLVLLVLPLLAVIVLTLT